MNHFFSALEQFFSIPDGPLGRPARITLYLLLMATFTFTFYIPLVLFLQHWSFLIGLAVGSIACFVSLLLLYHQHLFWAARTVILAAFLSIWWNTQWIGGVFSIGDLYLVPCVFFGWLVLGARTGVLLGLLSILGYLLTFVIFLLFDPKFSLPVLLGGVGHGLLVTSFKISLSLEIFVFIYLFHKIMGDAVSKTETLNANMSAFLSSDVKIATAIFDRNFELVEGTDSRYFAELFKHRNLLSVLQLCNIPDTSLVSATIAAALGEFKMTWDLNCDHLPKRALIQGRRHRLEFKPVMENGLVVRVLLVVDEIEELLEVRSQAIQQEKHSMLLLHFLSLGASKVCDFIERSRLQIAEAKRFIGANEYRLAFIAIHTVKGAARTLNCMAFAEQLHQLESKVQARLPCNFELVEQELLLLQNIADQLGYTHDAIIISRKQALEALERQNTAEYLLDVTNITVGSLFMSYRTDLSSLAKSLGKTAPDLVIEGNLSKIYLSREAKNAINQSLIHILRNALDHGIETPQLRKSTGKNVVPRISMRVTIGEIEIGLAIRDDGQGLDLEKIKQRAMAHGLFPEAMDEEEVARLIFAPGFSTADSATIISGRGVGMDAVKLAMQGIGGDAVVNLLGRQKLAPWEIRLSIPRQHILEIHDSRQFQERIRVKGS